jgi:hypothetical protein
MSEIYEFKYFEKAITAFIGNFELKINNIIPNIPVYMQDSGDDSYFLREKFEDKLELYKKIPRVIFILEDMEIQSDQDTNQYIKINYRLKDKNFNSQVRRKSINLPIVCNFVCSNYIKALEYLEVLISILSVDNAITYEHLGSVQQASFALGSISIEKNSMDMGGSKNVVIKANIDLQIQLFVVKYETIIELNSGGINQGNINGISSTKAEFIIDSENNIETYRTTLNPEKEE